MFECDCECECERKPQLNFDHVTFLNAPTLSRNISATYRYNFMIETVSDRGVVVHYATVEINLIFDIFL